MHKNTLKKSRLLQIFLSLVLVAGITGLSDAQQVSISGKIRTLAGDGLGDATVSIRNADNTFSQFQLSNGDGSYEFVIPAGDTYTITPSSDADPLLGVSSFDLALLGKYLDGEL